MDNMHLPTVKEIFMNLMISQDGEIKVTHIWIKKKKKIKRTKAITLLQISENKHKGIVWRLCSYYTILINVPDYCFGFNKLFYHLSCMPEKKENKTLILWFKGGHKMAKTYIWEK